MALTLSRVDRTPRTYVLADVLKTVPASVDGVQVALLPPRSGPTAATVWTTVTYASGSFDVLWVGPDADATGGLVVPASADAWVKVTDAPLVEAVKIERITVLGGGANLAAPLGVPVVSVNGKQGSAVVLSAADVGAQSAATLAADAAAHVADGSALDVALRAAFVADAALLKPGINLDIWPAMDPIPTTYADWIAGIDAELAGVATKTVVGQDSRGADIHLYDYNPGNAVRTVFLNSGQHPFEVLGQIGCRQFFIQFATSTHPAMVMLRKQIRVLWIPTAIASDFRGGRENGNGVNVNRNYPWNWSIATVDDPKGAAPLDQPEALAIKSVLDNYPVALMFDCHNFGSTASMDFAYATSPNLIQGKVLTMEKARRAWQAANPDAPAPTQYNDAQSINPTLNNWGGKYLRYDKQRTNAMTVLFECIATLGGSTTTTMTRSAVRWYSSFIYQTILTWLDSGQVDEPIPPFVWLATHNLSSGGDTTTVDIGGRRIDTDVWLPLQFSFTTGGSTRNYVGVPIRHPGRYEMNASIQFLGVGADDGTFKNVEVGISFTKRGTTATAPATNSVRTFQVPSGGTRRSSAMVQYVSTAFTTVPDDAIYDAQLWFRLPTGSTSRVLIAGTSGVSMTVKPTYTGDPAYQPLAN